MSPRDFTRRATVGLMAGVAATAGAAGASPGSDGAKERVVGVGGFFFKAKDPKALAKWYEDNLGISPVPDSYGGPSWETEAGTTVFAPFPPDTSFGSAGQQWMINFRVHDLDRMAAQLSASGIAVKVDKTTYPNGRFASLHDPEGNPIQLWQPAGKGAG